MTFPLVDDPSEFNEAILDRATALGRRDGLIGQRRDIALESFAQEILGRQAAPVRQILSAAFRQCYTAGHCHGAEVRRENEIRRQRSEAPILSLLPRIEEAAPFRLLAGASSWTAGPA